MNRLKIMLVACALVTVSHRGWGAELQTNEVLSVILELADGSRVIGTPGVEAVAMQTPYAKVSLPLKQILSITMGEDHEAAAIELRNGDKVRGIVNLAPIALTTVFGRVSVGIEHIRQITVTSAGAAMPESLREGLILHYSFDRDDKENVVDGSDRRNDGIVHGATWTPQGKRGGAYTFDGDDDFITMKPSAPVPKVGDFTVSLWTCAQERRPRVNGGGAPVERLYILDAHADAASGEYRTGFFLVYDFSNSGSCQIHNGMHFGSSAAGAYTEQNTDVDVADQWHHLVFGRRGADDFTYLDGKLLNSTYARKVPRSDLLDLNHTWSIGTFAGNNQRGVSRANYSFEGRIDEVMVFTKALSADDIKTLYEGTR